MTPDPDFALYASTGAHDSFRRLVERHIAHVHTAAHRRLGACSHLAADVTQAVFVKLARVARALPAETCLGMWLHRQAVSMSIDAIRSELRRRTREQTAVAMQHEATSSEAPRWQQVAPHLDDALERLPAADRTALVLRYFEERDLSAVGAALATTAEGARKRISRALEKLRLRLSKRGAIVSMSALELMLKTETVSAAPSALNDAITSAAANAGRNRVASLITAISSRAGSAGLGFAASGIMAGAILLTPERPAGPRGDRLADDVGITLPGVQPAGSVLPPVTAKREPQTVPEIVAAMKALYEKLPGQQRARTIDSLLRKVVPGDYNAFFICAGEQISTGDRIDLWGRILPAWRRHPDALTKAMFAADSGKAGAFASDLLVIPSITRETAGSGNVYFSRLDEAFKLWLRQAPEPAAKWLLDNHQAPLLTQRVFQGAGEGSLLDLLVAGLLAAPAAANSTEGQALMKSLTESGGSRIAYEQYLNQLFYNDELPQKTSAGKLKEIASQLAAAGNTSALRSLGYRWGLRRPEEFKEQAAGLVIPGKYWLALGGVAGEKDRLHWANVALSLASESSGMGPVLTDIVDAWLGREIENPKELIALLKEKALPEELPALLTRAAQQIARKPGWCHTALDIAMQIPESEESTLLLRGLYRQWLENRPAQAAQQLHKFGWPAGRLAALSGITAPSP